MNTTDYSFLALLIGGGFYISYRLFLGYMIGRSSERKKEKSAHYSESPRAENATADLER